MRTKLLFVTALLALATGCRSAIADAHPTQVPRQAASTPIQLDAASVAFEPGPPTLPAGVELAVLEGDPKQRGIFTLRLKAPAGFVLAPHTHPEAERVTVISGAISVGFGSTLDKESARTFEAGAYYVNPPGLVHYVFSDEGAIVQITGVGPWKVDFAQ